MLNFIGALQPLRKRADGKHVALARVCGRGQCESHEDAKEQLRQLYKKEHPASADAVDNEKLCYGGVFLFDCSPYELLEKVADDDSKRIIEDIYDEAIELAPFMQ